MSTGRKSIELVIIKVAGKEIRSSDYDLTEKKLTLLNLPRGEFDIEIEVNIKPQVSCPIMRCTECRLKLSCLQATCIAA